jgi:hypothetical protein
MTATMPIRQTRVRASTASVVLALTLASVLPQPAAAIVDVEGVHSEYDGCIAKFRAAGLGGEVDQLDRSGHTFVIERTDSHPHGSISHAQDKSDARDGSGTGGKTQWNPDDTSLFPDGAAEDRCATLYHEMKHLTDYDKGKNYNGDGDICFYKDGDRTVNTHITIAEVNATRAENEYRRSQKLDLRLQVDGHDLPPNGVDCEPPPPYEPPQGCNADCAISNGDPHLTTFDQVRYDFQAVGEFVLTRAAGGGLEVQVRQSAFPGSQVVSINTAIAANVAGDRVGVYLSAEGPRLHVGGVAMAPSAVAQRLGHGGTVSLRAGRSIDIGWPDGSELVVRPIGVWGLSLSLHLADARRGHVEGLLGDFDGQPADDFVVQAGTQEEKQGGKQGGQQSGKPISQRPSFADLYPRFADSWRVSQAQSLFDYGPGESTGTFTNRKFRARPVSAADLPNRAAAAALCRQAGVTDPPTLEACTLDVGLTGQAAFAADAVTAQKLTLGSGETTLAVTRPGTTARLTFPATAGQKIFVDIVSSNLPDQCGVLTLLDPADRPLESSCIINGQGFLDGTVLPRAGRYTIVLAPGDRKTGMARLRLVTAFDQAGTISPGGPEVTVRIGQPGAVTRLRFTATAGQKVFLDIPSSTLPDECGVVKLLAPGDLTLASGCIINGQGFVDGTVLPTAGPYTLLVDPGDRKAGTAELRLLSVVDQAGTIRLGGPEVTARIGQPGGVTRLRFTATAGQKVFLDIPSSTLTDECGVVKLLDRAHQTLASGCIINGKGAIPGTVLPATGEYTLLVDPGARGTGTAELRLHT